MSFFLHTYKKISKYVKFNTIFVFLLTILFVISLRFFERYKFYDFHEVIDGFKLAIAILSILCVYVCFKRVSNSIDLVPTALCFCFMYFCFELMFRQTFTRLNLNGVKESLMMSNVSYPFLIGLIGRPIIIIFALRSEKRKFLDIKNRGLILLVMALIAGLLTSLIDLYIILPHCWNLSEQKIIITYLDSLLINIFSVFMCLLYNFNNRNEFSNILLYSTLIPIFAKYYAFYANVQDSIYILASEGVIFILLLIPTLFFSPYWRGINIKNYYKANKYGETIEIPVGDGFSLDKDNSISTDKLGDSSYLRKVQDFIHSYASIEEGKQDFLLFIGVDGRINYASRRFYYLSGIEEEKVIGASFFTITHPEEILKAKILIKLEKNHSVPIVHRIRKKDGGYIWAESIANLIHEDDNIAGKVIIARAINHKKLGT